MTATRDELPGVPATGTIRVLVVDDHAMLAEGVASYLRQASDVEVVDIAGRARASACGSKTASPACTVLIAASSDAAVLPLGRKP